MYLTGSLLGTVWNKETLYHHCFSTFALEYAIKRVHVNQDGLKPNVTHQLLAYADDVNILGGGIHTLKEEAETLVAATGEIGLEVSGDKTKHMVMFRDQNAGRNHSARTDNSTFERVEEFKYLGTTLTNQNSIHEEIKSRLRSGNACYIRCRVFCLPGCYPKT